MLLMLVFTFFAGQLKAQLPYSESFKTANAPGLILGGSAVLTSGNLDAAGSGYLQLNSNLQSVGFARNTKAFSPANGLDISFEYFTYGGSGGDGLTFFLYDATANASFDIGAYGGSLGYAQNNNSVGVSKGYLALGLDEFGNFSNPTSGRVGGPGQKSSSIVLRGDGNGTGPGSGTNYRYIKGIQTTDASDMAAASAGAAFSLSGVNGRSFGVNVLPEQQQGYRKARLQLKPNGFNTGFTVNVWITEGSSDGAIIHHVLKDVSYVSTAAIPDLVSYGFAAAGAGSYTNFHEVRNLEITEPLISVTAPVLTNIAKAGLEDVTLHFSSADFSSKFSQINGNPLTGVRIENLPSDGRLKLGDPNNTHVVIGQELTPEDLNRLIFVPTVGFSGSASFQWNGTDGNSYSSDRATADIVIAASAPQLPYHVTFKNSTVSGLLLGGSAVSASLTSGTVDPQGHGYLRLTNNQTQQLGFARSRKSFPSKNGLSVSFDYYTHGGNGDGMTFFLFDATAAPFTIGAPSGGLGYAQNNNTPSSPGVSKGFVAMGLDEYGSFSSSGSGRSGGPGQLPSSVTLRGDGDGSLIYPSNYEFIDNMQTTDAIRMANAGAGNTFQIAGGIDGRSAGVNGLGPLDPGYRRAKLEMIPNQTGNGFILNVWITEGNPSGPISHHVIKDKSYLPTNSIPAHLSYGFAGTSGGSHNFHEVRNLEILVPHAVTTPPVIRNIVKQGIEDELLLFQLSDFTGAFYDPHAFNSLKDIEFVTLPAASQGVFKLNGVEVIVGQKVAVEDIAAAKMVFVPASNFNGLVSGIKWNGYNSSMAALEPAEIIINLTEVNDPPAGADKSITTFVNAEVVFSLDDFGYSDPSDFPSNAIGGVKIVSAPTFGSLKLNGTHISVETVVNMADISGGHLIYYAGENPSGSVADVITFQVFDHGLAGPNLDPTPNQIKINVIEKPMITFAVRHLTKCVGIPSVEYSYVEVKGAPDKFSIDWSAAANAAGIPDQINAALDKGLISVSGLSAVVPGVYTGTLVATNSQYLSEGLSISLSITIEATESVTIKYAGPYCNSGVAAVNLSGVTGGVFSSSIGLAINPHTGEIDLSGSTPGTYIVSYSYLSNTCSGVAVTSVVVNSLPVMPVISTKVELVAGTSINLSGIASEGRWSSSDVTIASVSTSGLISAHRPGVATITYTESLNNCTQTVSAKVTVIPVNLLMQPHADVSVNENQSYESLKPLLLNASVQNITYSLSGTDATAFSVNPFSGVVQMIARDFENPADNNRDNIYEVTLTATDEQSNKTTISWKVTVVDIDETPKFALNAITDARVNEGVSYKAELPVISGVPLGSVTYSLSGSDASFFNLNIVSGQVTMIGRNFETPQDNNGDNVYEVALTATDEQNNKVTLSWKVTIDKARKPVLISMSKISDVTINEGIAYSSELPVVTGSYSGKLTYSLVGVDASDFTIVPSTGIISMYPRYTNAPVDDNLDNIYEVGIKATDENGNYAVQSWIITVTKVEADAAISSFSPLNGSILANGKSIFSLTVTVFDTNGKQMTTGGDLVSITKLSGTGTIGDVKDNKNGTYTAIVKSADQAGKGIFVATVNGKEINPGAERAKAVISYLGSSNAQLSSLTLSVGRLSPTFTASITRYMVNVDSKTTSLRLECISADSKSRILVNGKETEKVSDIALNIGENIVKIVVKSSDGETTETYTIIANRAAPLMPYYETFRNSVANQVVLGGAGKLTAGTLDDAGAGYLRLTDNNKSQAGYMYSTLAFPSSKGFSIDFEFFMHGGKTGGGFSFFLYDSQVTSLFNIGAAEGSLGYSQGIAKDGLSQGFIGFGFDESGNFSAPSQGRQGGPGQRSSSVVLRGDGNGYGPGSPFGTNYRYITGVQTTSKEAMTLVGAGSVFNLAGNQNGRTAPGGSLDKSEPGYRKARIDMEPATDGKGFRINIYITENTSGKLTIHHILKDFHFTPMGQIPANLSYGFAAGNIGSGRVYELRNLHINEAGADVIPEVSDPADKNINQPSAPVSEIIELKPTNLISANGDGKNDTWVVRNIELFPDNTVRIFNRAGEQVYEKSNYNNDWDGTFNGSPLTTGTYYYIVDFKHNKPSLKGYISIIK